MANFLKQLFNRKPRREYLLPASPRPNFFFSILKHLVVGVLFILLGMLAVIFMQDARADITAPITLDQVKQGRLLVKTDTRDHYQPLPTLDTQANIHVSGMLARNTLTQTFNNPSTEWLEAIYVFPLPEQAAVDHLRMKVGERIIEGQIKPRQQAKKIYQQARDKGQRASLVEQQRPNLFTTKVANIAPGSQVVIEIEYQQPLSLNNNQFSLRFPMAITPRYIPGVAIAETASVSGGGWAMNTDQVSDASHITPPVHTGEDPINPVSIHITLDAGFPLQQVKSHYHGINQQMDANGVYTISLQRSQVASDRDFVLSWTPQVGNSPSAAFFSQAKGQDHYQMLMVLPPHDTAYDSQPIPRDVTFVIDTSGSMHGTSMDQARSALLMALDRLRLHDRFNVIQFNSSTESLFSQSRIASFDNVMFARRYVESLEANGGTEMAPALKQALQQQPHEDYIRQVVFLTDGSVGNETALFGIISKHLNQTRLFTIGIGSAPNSYFMRKAAQFGRGSFTYIGNVNEVSEKMTELFDKLERPIMSDLKLVLNESMAFETYPKKIPDLYAGEPAIIAIRSDRPIRQATLNGKLALTPWSRQLTLQQGDDHPGVATYWARQKIASLMDSLQEGASPQQVRDEVTQHALNHHLVSKYTSLVAVDVTPARSQQDRLKKHHQSVNLPHGQSQQKIFGQLPQTATPASLKILLGCLLLIIAVLSQHRRPPRLFNRHYDIG